jgi:AraC-like DNA-binding protein
MYHPLDTKTIPADVPAVPACRARLTSPPEYRRRVHVVKQIADGGGVSVEQVLIRVQTPKWSEPEASPGYRLVFVRQGAFRARVGGHVLLADPALAYAGGPGVEQSIAHRVGARDVCTSVRLSAELLSGLVPPGRPLSASMPVTGSVAVAERLLVARARQGADGFELAERATRLAGSLLGPARCASGTRRPATPAAQRRPATVAAQQRLADAARQALTAEPARLSLAGLARSVGCSPHHLSRVFHRETGLTLTRYRRQILVLAALDAIEAGERDLAGLAARLGFADHAHLTRSVRQECGCTPRDLRLLLAQPS